MKTILTIYSYNNNKPIYTETFTSEIQLKQAEATGKRYLSQGIFIRINNQTKRYYPSSALEYFEIEQVPKKRTLFSKKIKKDVD